MWRLSRKLQLILIAAGVIALAACGPLPRPFQPDHKPPPTGADAFGARAGLAVTAPDGMAPDEAQGLVRAITAALARHDIIATAGTGNRASMTLGGRRTNGTTEWTLRSAAGDEIARATIGPEAAGNHERHAAELAGTIAVRLRPAGADGGPVISVLPVDGAPGDGRIALSRAMGRALSRAGYRVTPDLSEATLLLAGSVYVTPDGPAAEAVAIAWTLMRLDGRRLGTVAQENTVAAGSLDGAWGATARAVAAAGANGVVALVRETARVNK